MIVVKVESNNRFARAERESLQIKPSNYLITFENTQLTRFYILSTIHT